MPSLALHHRSIRAALVPVLVAAVAGCGGGAPSSPISSFELLDPTPGAGDQFGTSVVILPNGNIVVTEPFDSSVASGNGAVHLYNPVTQTLIGSIYGDGMNDRLGSGGVTVLANGNFVIVSPNDSVGGVVNAGSVRLVNGATGAQVGSAIVGDVANDAVGLGGVTALTNGNFVIRSPEDDEGGIVDAGSVRLVNGTTGAQIGAAIVGGAVNDAVGLGGVTALSNGKFVVASPVEDVGGIVDAGSVRLVDGTTGAQIGAAITGDGQGDRLGQDGVTALANGNFVIVSRADGVGGVVNPGSVGLVNGTTGAQIGPAIAGDVANDALGSGGVTALPNGNFVILSHFDDEGGIVDAGSVRLVNGATGAQIGAAIVGGTTGDFFCCAVVTALANGNFVIALPVDDVGGIVNAGSVQLVDGTTGAQIGSAIVGDVANDALGSGGITALTNGNFVIFSPVDDEGGIVDASSVRLISGTTGVQIGAAFTGDGPGDGLGGVTALANGNFVITRYNDNVGVVVNAGSVRLVSGTTGAQIGLVIAGDVVNDSLGLGGVTALANGNFVILSPNDDEGGVVNGGSVRLVNGTTGVQIGDAITGSAAGDAVGARVTGSGAGDYYVLRFPLADKNGLADSGLARLIVP